MVPGARLAAAIGLLDAFAETPGPMDRRLADWARANRYAGAKDRAAISDLVYDALRRWRSLAAAGGDSGRGRLIAAEADRLRAAAPLDALFSGARFAPAPLTGEERARAAAVAEAGLDALLADAPPDERLDWPAAFWETLVRSDPDPAAIAAAQRARRPLDLRANGLKGDVEAARAALAAEGFAPEPAPLSPIGLRLPALRGLRASAAYEGGLVEIQDAASQAAALLTGARPAETVVDFCAGGGGKTLALAAMMGGSGRLIAHDIDPARLAELPARARRAGASVALIDRAGLDALEGRADLVLVDAPCSGSGAWARNPDAKWLLTPARLDQLRAAQGTALAAAAALVRPGGGRLVYATCSVFDCENGAAFATFLEAHADFAPTDLAPVWRAADLAGPPPAAARRPGALRLGPPAHDTDGFFVAAAVRA